VTYKANSHDAAKFITMKLVMTSHLLVFGCRGPPRTPSGMVPGLGLGDGVISYLPEPLRVVLREL